MLTIPGDADNLVEEQHMWSNEWNVAMGAMVEANVGTLAKGLTLRLPAAIIPGIQEVDDAFGKIVVDAIAWREEADRLEAEAQARAGSPMAEDLAPLEPVHRTPVASQSSWAMTQSKMEVVLPRVKGKKCSCQDLGSDEVAAFPPQGMVVHQDQCTNDQTGTVLRPIHAAAPVASPSVRPQPSAGSNKEEEAAIVVQAGKGKAISAWAKGVTVDEGDFEEIMWQLLVCESKVWDAQARSAELEGEVLGLKAYINRLCQK
ncbi:hypothetical protein PAXRUDRAFT_20281 [Paxillus rubicundulus Ve08.2h10]|uniref:Uncharacterized protein n=1 Tax=Paxillus rubicundulus Ve08.2h10 TaxID=930991 RepID=A0A0D0CF11_9AGAM|nr:hypothetical protein PAXRUDRAFT_20281 [Paxillus rubicundulus Ve08.2h10]